jgi:cytochrome b involved in lipid metabolism
MSYESLSENTSGLDKLKSNNLQDTPEIHFKYFEGSEQSNKEHVQIVINGIEFVQ